MFDSYRNKYDNVRMRREDGILEVALHSGGGPLVFNGYVHEALVKAFRDIGDDPENHVVILTGMGDEFCAQITPDGFDFFTPTGYDKILREGTKVIENLLDIQAPMIAAINATISHTSAASSDDQAMDRSVSIITGRDPGRQGVRATACRR